MKVFRKGVGKFKGGHFTFPIQRAELTDELISSLRMRAALRRFGKAVCENHNVDCVEIHTIGITYIHKERTG